MKRIITALLLLVSLALAACTSCAPMPSPAGQIDPARVQAGVMYLETTLATIEGAVAAAKVKYPEKAAAIDAQVQPVLTELRVAIAAFKAASAGQDMTKAMSAWDVARPLVTTALGVVAPYAIGALVK